MPTPIPVVNVNLAKCTCLPGFSAASGVNEHAGFCPATPVPIPCRPPPSFTCAVVLGECHGACLIINNTRGYTREIVHDDTCPARPVKVSCSISGAWEESEVTNVDIATTGRFLGWDEEGRCIAACRARWALVKALVLGMPQPDVMEMVGRWNIADLFAQRDAVYAALADMARAEDMGDAAAERATKAMGSRAAQSTWPRRSVPRLAEYVERIMEQVSILGVGP